MKVEEKLKVLLTILTIILICLVSFGGIFVTKTKFVENIIPEYQLGTDLKGSRMIGLEVSTATVHNHEEEAEGEEGSTESEGSEETKQEESSEQQEEVEVPVNAPESLTTENYKKVKQIIEKRLKDMQVANYTIRQNEETGKIFVSLPENNDTDVIIQYLTIKGVFTVQNEEGEILLDNSHVKKAQVGYSATENGTAIYLTIKLNKEGTAIFKDITNNYRATTDEEGKETKKEITLKIDDSELLTTHFDQEISNGTIQMSIGSASSDASTIDSYVKEASNIAVLLNNGSMPLTYSIEENRYVMSDITIEMLYIPLLIIGIIFVIGMIILIVKYKGKGLLSIISLIGYIGVLLVVLRYTNVELTLEGITAIFISIIMNYVFTLYVLNTIKNSDSKTYSGIKVAFKESLVKSLFVFVPVTVIAVLACFAKWVPIYSFGMVMFWGLLIALIYDLIFTRSLLVNTAKK